MNYTSVEQSKKLLELGLSLNISDMIYPCLDVKSNLYDKPIVRESLLHAMHTTIECKSNDIPCWSVGALLEVMPPYLFEWEKGIDLEIYPALNKSRWQVSYISRDMSPENNDRYTKIMFGDTLIEAAYNMVVWLLENNYIKQ